jgi:hypothetical protein
LHPQSQGYAQTNGPCETHEQPTFMDGLVSQLLFIANSLHEQAAMFSSVNDRLTGGVPNSACSDGKTPSPSCACDAVREQIARINDARERLGGEFQRLRKLA